MTKQTKPTLAVIGGGLAGATLCHELAQNFQVTLFEKSRGLGGRLAYKHVPTLGSFDMGAQYFTIRDPEFRKVLMPLLNNNQILEWQADLVYLNASNATYTNANETYRYYSHPKSNQIVHELISQSQISKIELNATIVKLSRVDRQWFLTRSEDQRSFGPFSRLMMTLPCEQSRQLISQSLLDEDINFPLVSLAPCWCLLLAVPTFSSHLDFQAAFVKSSPISWIALNNSKEGRAVHPDIQLWTVHAESSWTRRFNKEHVDQVQRDLWQEFVRILKIPAQVKPLWTYLHYWKYSIPEHSTDQTSFYHPDLGLGLCGDWFVGGRVEGAFQSARSLINKLKIE